MEGVLSLDNLFTLAMLILLQAVLGFDNLLYISIESKRVPPDYQAFVRRMGIGLAIILRIILLFVILEAIQYFQDPIYSLNVEGFLSGIFNVHSLIVLLGGIFIIYTAVNEISHLLSIEELESNDSSGRSVFTALFWIVTMNLIFSFDSILSAIALTDIFWIIAIAIVVSGLLMIWLSDHVAEFLKKNRTFEVLGLFILLIVGILLLSEGGHLAHLTLFGFAVEPMSKTTFYFAIFVLVVVNLIQTRFQKKLALQRKAEQQQMAG